MRTYLVTGGAGFIGSNFVYYMFRKYGDDIRLINVDALTYAGNLENLKGVEDRKNYTFIKADIRNKETIEKIFAENDIDVVVHFAAESHVDRSIVNPEVFVETNVLGTAVMLNAAKAVWEERSSCMCLLMRYTVHLVILRITSMRLRPTIRIHLIPQARHRLIFS